MFSLAFWDNHFRSVPTRATEFTNENVIQPGEKRLAEKQAKMIGWGCFEPLRSVERLRFQEGRIRFNESGPHGLEIL